MSYIRNTMQCDLCKRYINVSTGTFGGGVPQVCNYCNARNSYNFVRDGWWAEDDGTLRLNEFLNNEPI